MKPCTYIESLSKAETACAEYIHRITGENVHIAENPGLTDCAVFDIGCLQTGEHATFKAPAYHFRAKLDIYRRSRQNLQVAAMRILESFPINADCNEADALRSGSNVHVFRLAPQPQGLSEATTASIVPIGRAEQVKCWTVTLLFDVVFQARFE